VRNVAPNRMKRHDGFPEKDKRDALLIATVILFQLLKLMKCEITHTHSVKFIKVINFHISLKISQHCLNMYMA